MFFIFLIKMILINKSDTFFRFFQNLHIFLERIFHINYIYFLMKVSFLKEFTNKDDCPF